VSESDEEYIAAFLRGDELAFRELLERYQEPVLGLLQRMTRDRQAAEDLFQEVFLKVFRQVASLRDRTRFRVWLFRIAVHQARRFFEQHKRMADMSVADQSIGQEPDVVERDDLLARVRDAVELLPERQREVVVLRAYQGLSYEEIAEALGVTAENARANFYQGMKKLKRDFGPETGEPA
jgi:RNA polymerase sigma-70 factor (ECF subfamily)